MEYRNPKELKPHPISIKLYGINQIEDIKESITKLGILVPLTITEDNLIISGHRRWRCATELELDSVPVEVKTFASELEEKRSILEYNRQREKNFSQKMHEAELIKDIIIEEAHQRQIAGVATNPRNLGSQGKTADIVGKQVDIGRAPTFRKAEKIWGKALEGDKQAQELVKAIDTEDKTIGRAYRELQATEKRIAFVASKQKMPQGIFDVFYADPPWKYEFGEVSREVDNQYPPMTLQEIRDLGLQLDAHISDTAVIFLWATAPKLLEALDIMKSWGFSYRTNAVWDKEKIGMGYWFRGQHELLLVGVKGKYPPPATEARFSSVIKAPRANHSTKPQCVYEMIEAICPNSKYLELFARTKRGGWQSWGNQGI